ncbi:Ig-like domain-containing protein, partial [Flavobacterium sp. LS2R12]
MKTFLLKSHFLTIVFLIANLFFAEAAFGQATVTTDKDDYAPGEYVIITGTGWAPGETVTLHFDETPKPATCLLPHDMTAVADSSGNIYNNQFLIKINHIGVAFLLTATGQTSGLVATRNFTDANTSLTDPNPDSAFVYGSIVTISSKLTQNGTGSPPTYVGNGNPIPGKTITFSGGGTPLGTGITNANGIASSTVSISLAPGSYTSGTTKLKADFAGDPSNNPYASKNVSINFTVAKANTSFSAVSGYGVYGGNVGLKATTNLNVAGLTINFTLNGTAVGFANTDALGVATLVVPFVSIPVAVKNAGTHANEVGASIANTTNYSAALGTGNLVISKAATTTVVTITGAPFTYTGSAIEPATVSVTGAGGLSLTPTAV